MSTGQIPQFSKEIPDVEGYYWWKEDYFKTPEIVHLEINEEQKNIYRCGDDRLWTNDSLDYTGLFSDKVLSLWEARLDPEHPELY